MCFVYRCTYSRTCNSIVTFIVMEVSDKELFYSNEEIIDPSLLDLSQDIPSTGKAMIGI